MKEILHLAFNVVINGLAIVIIASFLPGISIANNSVGTFLLLGVVIGLVNGVLRPILKFLTFPLTFLTLGLFALVLNALLLLLVGQIVPGLHINGFLPALIGSIILGFLTGFLEWIMKKIVPDIAK